MADDTLTLAKLRDTIAALGPPPPDFIVSIYAGAPIKYAGTIYFSPDDAKTLHAKSPLILRQVMSPTSGRYTIASPFDGPFPLELRLPPFCEQPGTDALASGIGSCVAGILILAALTLCFTAITGYSIGIR